MKKYILLLLVAASTGACSSPADGTTSGDLGKSVYEKNCKLCHGIDGKQQLNGAKDLNLSILSIEERIHIITNGKNVMVPFKDILSEEEIKAVAAFTKATFK